MNFNNEIIEKIKALELSNFIDKEEEKLISDGGYYTKTGKEAVFDFGEAKNGAFYELQKLEKEINKKVFNLNLGEKGNEISSIIKSKKLEMIKKNLSAHEMRQIEEWISQTLEEGIQLSIKKGIFHREDDREIASIIQNGEMIIMLKCELLGYDINSFKIEAEKYENLIITGILDSYAKENNLKILDFYKKYKKNLNKNNQEKYEKISNETEVRIKEEDLAKRIFDLYPDDKKEAFSLLEKEKGKEYSKNLLKSYFSSKEKNEEEKENSLLTSMFQEISKTKREGLALNYNLIPYELNEENKKCAKTYLESLMRGDEIETSLKSFLFLYEKYKKNPLKFSEFNFIKYKMFLSDYDFKLFLNLGGNSLKISQSEAFDTINLIDNVIFDFEDKKKVEYIRYFFDDLFKAEKEKPLDFKEKKEIIEKRVLFLYPAEEGFFKKIKDKFMKQT